MASIQGGSGNELFFHGSTFLFGDGAKIDLDSATAKYYVCAAPSVPFIITPTEINLLAPLGT